MSVTILNKWLYESTIQKDYETKLIEKKEDGTEISTPIKKLKPVKIALLKPNRRLHESSEIFYAKSMANLIKEGLMPFSLVAKRYSNDGGALSEPEKLIISALKKDILDKESEFFVLVDTKEKIEDIDKQKRDLLIKINDLNQQKNLIENSYADIYENTAEVKAKNKLVEWWILNLSYFDEDGKGYKPFFGEGNLDDKFNKYDEYLEQDNLFYNDLLNKFSSLISFWFSSRTILSSPDFSNAEKMYDERLSTYQIDVVAKIKEEESARNQPKIEQSLGQIGTMGPDDSALGKI